MPISTIKHLEQFLSYCSVKNKILDENISNIATENYKRKDLAFKDLFKQDCMGLLKTTDEKHFSSVNNTDDKSFSVEKDYDPNIASGINNVDIE